MCKGHKGCTFPELLKEIPEKCSKEQVAECHGDDKGHPCVSKEESDSP